MKNLYLIIAAVIFFCSCQKDEITVKLKMSGTLSVKVVDNNKQALANQKVKLYYGSTSSSPLDKIVTNSNGEVNFGELNDGTYYVVVDTPKVNGIKYLPVKPVQVISGSNKSVTINVQEYSGTVKITVINYSTYNPLANYNVILIPYEKFSSSDNNTVCISKAEFTAITNTAGQVTFQIPSSREFVLMVYDNTKTNVDKSHYINVDQEEIQTTTIQMYIY